MESRDSFAQQRRKFEYPTSNPPAFRKSLNTIDAWDNWANGSQNTNSVKVVNNKNHSVDNNSNFKSNPWPTEEDEDQDYLFEMLQQEDQNIQEEHSSFQPPENQQVIPVLSKGELFSTNFLLLLEQLDRMQQK